MELETIKSIIQSQWEETEEELAGKKLIPRSGLQYVQPFLSHPNILAILGVRRCGKSVFSLLLSRALGGKVGYINFYDERLLSCTADDLEKIMQAFYELYSTADIVILDEIQLISGWELFFSRLRKTKKVIITGSNSKLLSGELATYLTGRHLDFTLYPLSFKEVLGFKPNIYSTKDRAKARVALSTYLTGSGFAEYYLFGKPIIKTIYEDIITKDCLKRYPIREEQAFRRLAQYLISNSAQEFSYSKLSGIVGIKDFHTVSNYVNYLKESFLLLVLERYSPKLKEQIIAPKKAYVVDHGLSLAVGFTVSENRGRIFENVVLIELMRRKNQGADIDCFYYKDHQGHEVDFVVKERLKVKELIQVCYDLSNEETKARELRGLAEASKELRCTNLVLITSDLDKKEALDQKFGVKAIVHYVPLWKWLLGI